MRVAPTGRRPMSRDPGAESSSRSRSTPSKWTSPANGHRHLLRLDLLLGRRGDHRRGGGLPRRRGRGGRGRRLRGVVKADTNKSAGQHAEEKGPAAGQAAGTPSNRRTSSGSAGPSSATSRRTAPGRPRHLPAPAPHDQRPAGLAGRTPRGPSAHRAGPAYDWPRRRASSRSSRRPRGRANEPGPPRRGACPPASPSSRPGPRPGPRSAAPAPGVVAPVPRISGVVDDSLQRVHRHHRVGLPERPAAQPLVQRRARDRDGGRPAGQLGDPLPVEVVALVVERDGHVQGVARDHHVGRPAVEDHTVEGCVGLDDASTGLGLEPGEQVVLGDRSTSPPTATGRPAARPAPACRGGAGGRSAGPTSCRSSTGCSPRRRRPGRGTGASDHCPPRRTGSAGSSH